MERLQSGGWWKFDRYEIRDGYICPAAGAQLVSYDPWAAYQQAHTQKARAIPPHTQLLRLVKSVRFVQRGRGVPTPTKESAAQLLEWCGAFGLLGVLLQRVQTVTFPHRWEPAILADGHLMPACRRYSRINWGWASRIHPSMHGDTVVIEDMGQLHQLVPDDCLPPQAPRPGTLVQDLRDGSWELEGLDRTWATFFPSVAESDRLTGPYPLPLTPAFWLMYAEPVATFIDAAAALADAVALLDEYKDTLASADVIQISNATDGLHTLLRPIAPGLQVTDEGFREKWISPSLLSTLAMMVFQDITGGRRILKCQTCGSYFFSSAYQARYCGERCRQTGQKREWRARQQATDAGCH